MAARRPTREELGLWRQVTENVARLRRPPPSAGPAEEPPAAAPAPERPVSRRAPAPPTTPPPAGPAPLVLGGAAGIDRRTATRFRRGAMAIDDRLDLHGLTQAAAHRALVAAVLGGRRAGRRMLLVITGKGRVRVAAADLMSPEAPGVLRRMVPRWLAEPDLRLHVLAIERARPEHGGEGAFYVLLKRERERP